ncbi:hypothetical protein RBB84_18610 [Rhodococcus sp. D-6]|uniref:Uncharacterized protein n=2 Tax=Rhodococcus TaxID=1827 RepID=A0A7M2XXW2_9NOCA|nr:hypothetical protein [Rhodococcus pyridinivorans]QOW01911.1 hypothetical protein INP59_27535 [Rhodococcus pyridinivorans]
MTKKYGRRNGKRGPKPKVSPCLPSERSAAQPPPDLPAHTQPSGFVLVCGNVGLTPLSPDARAELIASVNAHQALTMVAELYSELDIARSTHWQVRPISERVLVDIEAPWASRAFTHVRQGDHFLTSRGLGQLMREILEHGAFDTTLPPLDTDRLGRLLLSISSEQHSHPEFAGDLPTEQEIQEVVSRTFAMDLDATRIALRELIPDEIASYLYDTTLKLEILQANTYDTWFSPWPIEVNDPLLGQTPADAFASATGVDLRGVLQLGRIVEAQVRNGALEFTRNALLDKGAEPAAVDLLARSMSLSPAKFQRHMLEDRARGEVGHQRYTMTQFPFVAIDPDTFLLLRYQWGIDRFFGSTLHWETFGSFEAAGHRTTAKRFNQAMDFTFEHQVGRVLTRMARSSRLISHMVTEKEMQAQWTTRAGRIPSSCDWALLGDKITVVLDATNHPMNAALAQGLASVEAYEGDIDRTFTDRKFKQLAATISELRDRGWDGTNVGSDTDFIPLVIVPDTGLPNTTLIDYDLQVRSLPIFTEFEPHVFAPAVLTYADLQLLEGIADHYPGDIVELIGGWRHACMRTPIPIRLDDFLDQWGIQRPISKQVNQSHRALAALLGSPALDPEST